MSTKIPETTEALLLVEYDAPLKLEELPVPDTLEPRALLVEVEVTTLCGSDVHVWDGTIGKLLGAEPPFVLGHEFVGRIVAIGDGAETDSVGEPLAIGDRIVWTHGTCGACRGCVVLGEPSLCENPKRYMFSSPREFPYLTGGFAKHCYVFPGSGRLKVPDSIDSAMASASSCALRTVMHAYGQLGEVRAHQSVVVQGAGPVGLFAAAVARRRGASHVTVIGDPQERLDVALAWGADEVLPVSGRTADERVQVIVDLTKGGGDVVIEASGAQGAFGEGVQMLARGGRYLVVGQLSPTPDQLIPAMLVTKQASIIGSLSGHTADYWAALQFLAQYGDELSTEAMITSHVDFSGATEALGRMQRFEDVKVAVHPHGVPPR